MPEVMIKYSEHEDEEAKRALVADDLTEILWELWNNKINTWFDDPEIKDKYEALDKLREYLNDEFEDAGININVLYR